MPTTLPAYKGDEPYIFVSYAHADEQIVASELERLRENDYLVWYDEGISGGTRWTEDIAQRIRNASLVLYFVTPNSAASENCANEIDYALDNQRPVLAVHLKPAELSEGQKLALGGRQMIMRHQLSEQEYLQKLLEAIATQFGRIIPTAVYQQKSFLTRPSTIVASVALAVLLSIGLWYGLTESDEPKPAKEMLPILIADFDNQTGVGLFDGTLESTLATGIEDAPFISSYLRSDARKKLKSLDLLLDEEGARLIAVRENLKLVIVGEVITNGEGFDLTIRAIEPVSGTERVVVSEIADSQDDVLDAIASLARQVRSELGDVTVQQTELDETMSARSLEAIAHYAKAQALAAAWHHEEAVLEYDLAVSFDDQLGRAYGGWAYSTLQLGHTSKALKLWERMITLLHTMTEREQLSAMGMYYANAVYNNEKATETFAELVEKYPADARGANNLSMMYFLQRNFEQAIEVLSALLVTYPERALYRANFSLFYMYDGDFDSAKREAEKVLLSNPDYYVAYLPQAAAGLTSRNYNDANAAYDNMASIGGQASYLAAIGRIDLAMARGEYASAIKMLDDLISSEASRSLVREHFWLTSAQLRSGDNTAAKMTIDAIDASALREGELFQLGEIYVVMKRFEEARKISRKLRAKLRDVPRAYADLLAGQVALAQGDHSDAIDFLNDSLERSDMWLAHFVRGKIYLDAGLSPEAMEEFALCLEREGEGFAVFLDDIPTYHRLVETRYWYGRALQEIGQMEPAALAYQDYVNNRDLAATDPIVMDAQQRLGTLVNSN